jgi:hypothetical protein
MTAFIFQVLRKLSWIEMDDEAEQVLGLTRCNLRSTERYRRAVGRHRVGAS